MRKRFLLFLTSVFFLLVLAACIPLLQQSQAGKPLSTADDGWETGIVAGKMPDWITVYFTDPDSPHAGSYRGGPDEALALAIQQARLRVDVAIHRLNLWSIRDALLCAHRRGVTVRVVTESDNIDEAEMQDLIDAGIPVLGDRRESLMHNKFVVIDGSEVWTGSMNFTTTGAYRNDNVLMRIRSRRLAENYTTEFEEMFTDDHFGDHVERNTPYPSLVIDGVEVETLFSPDDGVAKRIGKVINTARNMFSFMAFSFTSNPLANDILDLSNKGVAVSGVLEESQYYSNIGSDYDRFVKAGLDVRLDGNRNNMHHKTMIVDSSVVITGSYNFSKSAEKRNDENVLIIHSRQVALLFLNEFQRVYEKAKP